MSFIENKREIPWDERMAAQYAYNFPEVRLLAQSVQSVAPEQLETTDHIHLSPPCTEASIANPGAVESEASISAAFASINIICSIHRRGGAKWITLENVWGYSKFKSFQIILNGLRDLGYAIAYQKLNAANFGTPQNRERLWLRAVRADCVRSSRQLSLFGLDELLPLCPTAKKISWWEAIFHLEPELPVVSLNACQLKRLPRSLIAQRAGEKLILIGKEKNQAALASAPSFTITSTVHKQLPVLIKRTGANNSERPIPHSEVSPTI
jgi:site-specific DNA-cytosine methylase